MSGGVAIIGLGHVGHTMARLFPDAAIYDKYLPDYDNVAAIAGAALTFICVPTDELPSGRADISIVTEAVKLADGIVCIRSTVPPGTTDYLRALTGKRLTFCPEYQGETPWQRALSEWPYVIVGSMVRTDANAVLAAFQQRLGPHLTYVATDARTAELVKYMENAWLALQVTFAGEMYDIAKVVGADYNQARELWALDPRVSKWHTLVFEGNRGFAGKCLPKDLEAIIFAAKRAGHTPTLLEAVRAINDRVRKANGTKD